MTSPGGVKACGDCALQLIARDKHSAAAQVLQVLHDDEVVVGLDGIANDAVQPLEGSSIGLKVLSDGFLAVTACSAPAAVSGDHISGLCSAV